MHIFNKYLFRDNLEVKKFLFKILLVLMASLIQDSSLNKLYSQNLTSDDFKPSIDYLNKKDAQEYILGIGDIIKIEIIKNDSKFDFSSTVDITGKIDIPEFNRVYVKRLTIKELTRILNEKYSNIIKSPDIKIEVLNYRSINVYLDGEIQDPGLYKFNLYNEDIRLDNEDIRLESFPTLFEVIKKAGGITNYADLTKVEIIRNDTISNGGGKIKTEINFLDFFLKGNETLNLRIFDGDVINIKKTIIPITGQISKALQSNINPKTIEIIINGQVEVEGPLIINKNSTLNDAITYAGGFRLGKGKVKILSFQRDGNLINKQVTYQKNAKRGSDANPFLSNGDVILVGKSSFKKTRNMINEYTNPFVNIYSLFRIFDLIN